MEFVKDVGDESIITGVSSVIKSFEDRIHRLEHHDTEPWRRRIAEAQDMAAKTHLLKELMEINLPMSAIILDKLLEEHKKNVLEYLQFLSLRQRVTMSTESFTSAQKLAEKAHVLASTLYNSQEEDDDPSWQVYKAYFTSCIDLFLIYRYEGRLENAKNYLEFAKAAAEEACETEDLNLVQILEGDLLLAKCHLTKAIKEYFTPLLNNENLTEENRGLLLQKLGNGCRSAAEWGAAKTHLRESIEIARKLGDRVSEHDRIADLGNVYRSEGRTADALDKQSCHMAFSFSRGDLWGSTVACFNMGFTYYSVTPQPELERALIFLSVKHDLAARTHNEVLRGMALNNLGKAFCAIEKYEAAVEVLKECVKVAKKTGNLGGEGMAYGNLGTTYRNLGKYDDAIEHHEKYRENAVARGDDGGAAIMQRELALDYFFKKDLDNAEKEVKNAILTLEGIRSKLGTEDSSKLANFDKNQAEAYNLLQVILVHQGKPIEALAFSELARGRAITDIIRDTSTATMKDLWLWKDSIFTKNKLSDSLAQDIICDFYNIADDLQTSFLVYSVVTDYPSVQEKVKNLYTWLVKCSEHLREGSKRITFNRIGLDKQVQGSSLTDEKFFTSLTRTFRSMSIPKTCQDKPSLKEKKESDSIGEDNEGEKLKLVFPEGDDVSDFMKLLESLSFKRVKPPQKCSNENQKSGSSSFEDSEKKVRDMKQAAETGIESTTPLNRENHGTQEEETRDCDRYEEQSSWKREGLEQLSALYNVCIAPIENDLPTPSGSYIPKITIIPQEFLFNVPFCALLDKNQQYFVERCVLSYTPSLRALYHLQQRYRAFKFQQGEEKLKILAVGDPTFSRVLFPDLYEIINSGIEAEHVQSVFGSEQCSLVLRKEAKKSLVLEEMKKVDILHIAAHAGPTDLEQYLKDEEGGDYIMRGCVLLSSSNDDCNGVLEAKEIANTKCSCQLVMLSCCETGLGKLTGDGVVGIYRAFIAAGAAAIVVTLWKIQDAVTPLFMEKFYSVFKETEDVPLALHQAMMFCLKEKNLPPQQWAAFSYIGAPCQSPSHECPKSP